MSKRKSVSAPVGMLGEVDAYVRALEHPLKSEVETLRMIILGADALIGEQIKWNAPAFFYRGEMKPFDPKEYKRDIVVFNLRATDHVLLVFPTGARIDAASGLLEGDYTDGRRLAKFRNMDDVSSKKCALLGVIADWLRTVEK